MTNKKTALGKVLIDLKLADTLNKYARLLEKVENACPKSIKQQVKGAATHTNKRAEEAVRLIEHFDKHSKDMVDRIIKEAEEKARNGLHIDRARNEAEKAFEELKNMVERNDLKKEKLKIIKDKFLSLASKEAKLCEAWLGIIGDIGKKYSIADSDLNSILDKYTGLKKNFEENAVLLIQSMDALIEGGALPTDLPGKFETIKVSWNSLKSLQQRQSEAQLALAKELQKLLQSSN